MLQRPLLLIRFERRPLGCPVSWLSTYTLLEEATALNHIPRIVSIRESAASALLSASDPMRRVSRRNRDKTSPQSHTFLKSLLGMQIELSLRLSSSFASCLLPIEPRSFVDPPLEGSARWVRPYKTVPPPAPTRAKGSALPRSEDSPTNCHCPGSISTLTCITLQTPQTHDEFGRPASPILDLVNRTPLR